VFSWLIFPTPLTLNTRWRHIAHLTNFGKWIWGNSVLTLLLNQLDKILVARYLGVSELGFYQTAARICQLLIAEPVMALGQYLFPTYAKLFRDSPQEARRRFLNVLKLTFAFLTVAVAMVLLTSGPIIGLVLGEAWYDTQRLAQLFVFPMAVGAIIAIFVPYLRAIAQPKQILIASGLQLITLAGVAPFLIQTYGATGMIMGSGVACIVSLTHMVYAALWANRVSPHKKAKK
jgi:O-antigen/teichoic acid export membrane protein